MLPLIWVPLLVLVVVETYLLLPPGIPLITSPSLVSLQTRFANYAVVILVAYTLYAFGFSLLDSLGLASFWMTLAVYLVFDYFYDVPLLV